MIAWMCKLTKVGVVFLQYLFHCRQGKSDGEFRS